MQKLEQQPGCTAGCCKAAGFAEEKREGKRSENCPRRTLYIAVI